NGTHASVCFLFGSEAWCRNEGSRRNCAIRAGFSLSRHVCSPRDFEQDQLLDNQVVEAINRTRPDFLFVALGPPKAESWIYTHLRRLDVAIAMPVGGAFDMLAGDVRRAPHWMQHVGLEWLWRLLQEP